MKWNEEGANNLPAYYNGEFVTQVPGSTGRVYVVKARRLAEQKIFIDTIDTEGNIVSWHPLNIRKLTFQEVMLYRMSERIDSLQVVLEDLEHKLEMLDSKLDRR